MTGRDARKRERRPPITTVDRLAAVTKSHISAGHSLMAKQCAQALVRASRAEHRCECTPCPDCGYKHYCNLSVDHESEPRTGECPPSPGPWRA